jgi:hypothetical protein
VLVFSLQASLQCHPNFIFFSRQADSLFQASPQQQQQKRDVLFTM